MARSSIGWKRSRTANIGRDKSEGASSEAPRLENAVRFRTFSHARPLSSLAGENTAAGILEGNIVVGDFCRLDEVVGRAALVVRGTAAAAVRAAPAAFALSAAGEQGNVVEDNFCFVSFLPAGLVVPGLRAQTAFYVELGALLHVVADDLGELAEGDDIVPLGAVRPLTVLVFEALGGSDRKGCHGVSSRREFDFRIFPDIAEQDDFVDAFCHEISCTPINARSIVGVCVLSRIAGSVRPGIRA